MKQYYEWSKEHESFVPAERPETRTTKSLLYYCADSSHLEGIVQFEKESFETEGYIFADEFDEEKSRAQFARNTIDSIDSYKLLVVEHMNRIVGRLDLTWMYDIDEENYVGFINWIYVLKSFRGMGIGKGLLDFCKDELGKTKINTVKLLVGKGNLAAQEFYRNCGFDLNSKMVVCELKY